jgi:hypothetical protein
MIYRSRGEQANHYTINAIQDKKTNNSPQNTTQKTDGEAFAPLALDNNHFLSCFILALHCLFFDLRLLIKTLASSIFLKDHLKRTFLASHVMWHPFILDKINNVSANRRPAGRIALTSKLHVH